MNSKSSVASRGKLRGKVEGIIADRTENFHEQQLIVTNLIFCFKNNDDDDVDNHLLWFPRKL